jgi:cytochrome P450
MTFYSYCFNESLRMQPPVYFSSTVCMMEDVTVNGFTIQKGDGFSIDMYRLGNNPAEWKEPKTFLPERFDPQSDYFLTPAGERRNPYSFSPFLGGQRSCIGKTLVESISKLTLPTLWTNFDIKFEDHIDTDSFKLPANNLLCTREPEVNVIITQKK